MYTAGMKGVCIVWCGADTYSCLIIWQTPERCRVPIPSAAIYCVYSRDSALDE